MSTSRRTSRTAAVRPRTSSAEASALAMRFIAGLRSVAGARSARGAGLHRAVEQLLPDRAVRLGPAVPHRPHQRLGALAILRRGLDQRHLVGDEVATRLLVAFLGDLA